MTKTQETDERRRHCRLNARETILLELVSTSFDGSSPPEVLICHSVDISAGGLQVTVNHPLQTGLILNMSVHMEEALPIHMVTEVKWHFPAEFGGGWVTGLELLDSDGSGLAEWKRFIARRIREG